MKYSSSWRVGVIHPFKKLSNIERNSVHYELASNDNGREKKDIVPASVISPSGSCFSLADNGLVEKEGQKMKLTERQRRFCDFFTETRNTTEATRLAGNKGKNLNRVASQNLSKLDIQTI